MEQTERVERSLAFALGLDLGQAGDYTALVINECVKVSVGKPAVTREKVGPFVMQRTAPEAPYFCENRIRYIHRFPLKATYPEIIKDVGDRIGALKHQGRVLLTLDHTGVGRAIVNMFRQARFGISICGVTITNSQQAMQDLEQPWLWTVPKKDLVGSLQSQFHQDRVKIAESLAEATALLEELQNFRMKRTTPANSTFDAWREGENDDLVLAAALAVWSGERVIRPGGVL